MNQQSPQFKLTQMIPLSMNKKQVIEDEPIYELIESGSTKITFNEQMIVCKYKPSQKVTHIQKTIEKLKGNADLKWINPSISNQYQVRSHSILKNNCHFIPESLCVE